MLHEESQRFLGQPMDPSGLKQLKELIQRESRRTFSYNKYSIEEQQIDYYNQKAFFYQDKNTPVETLLDTLMNQL